MNIMGTKKVKLTLTRAVCNYVLTQMDICMLLYVDPAPELQTELSSDLSAHFNFTAVKIPKLSLPSPEPLITTRVI